MLFNMKDIGHVLKENITHSAEVRHSHIESEMVRKRLFAKKSTIKL
jgi:hypothetical protein